MSSKAEPMITLSLGWGIQSFTLGAMSALGELPPVDYAIHADTTWETAETYKFAAQWTPWLEDHGVNVVTVTAPNTGVIRHYSSEAKGNYKGVAIPAFTLGRNNKRGQVRRQCTEDWKIKPIRRFLQRVRGKETVDQWLGISVDEIERAGVSQVKYIRHVYPLLDLGMTRADCADWLVKNNLPIPPKSACVFCPFHNRRAWAEQKRAGGSDWEISLQVDQLIRDARPPNDLFVHPDRVPLAEAVDIPEDHGMFQSSWFEPTDDRECNSAHCFL